MALTVCRMSLEPNNHMQMHLAASCPSQVAATRKQQFGIQVSGQAGSIRLCPISESK